MSTRAKSATRTTIVIMALLLAGCDGATSEPTQRHVTEETETPIGRSTSPLPTSTTVTLPEIEFPPSTPFIDSIEDVGVTAYQLRPEGIVSYVWTIAVAADESLWFGGVMGAVNLDRETWAIYGTEQGLPHENVQAIVVDHDGVLWFATLGGGVSRFTDRRWQTYTIQNGLVDNSVTSAFVASDGSLWFGTYGGLSHYDAGNWKSYTRGNGLSDNTINAIAETPNGVMWFGTTRGLSRFDGSSWTNYGFEEGLRGGLVRALAVAPDGTLWIGTQGTLNHFDGTSWSYVTQQDGLADARIEALYTASDGTLWVGSIGGFSQLIGDRWINHSRDHDLQTYDIHAILEGPDGAIWLAGGYNHVYRFFPPANPDLQVPVRKPSDQVFTRPIIPLADGEPVIIEHIEMIDSQTGWALGGRERSSDHVLRTFDGGATWEDVSPPALRNLATTPSRTSAFFYDSDRAWIVYNDGASVWMTSDGGQSWRASQLDYSRAQSDRLFFTHPQRGWLLRHVESGMGSQYVALYRTQDGGHSWDKLIDPYDDEDLQGCVKTGMVFNDEDGWVTYDCQGLYADPLVDWSPDGGQTWQPTWLSSPYDDADTMDAYCTTKNPHLFSNTHGALLIECNRYEDAVKTIDRFVYITYDRGTSWTKYEFPGEELYFLSDELVYALGHDIAFSNSGGKHWTSKKSVQWDAQFSFVSTDLGWAVATFEDEIALLQTVDGARTWLEIKPSISTP